MKKINIILITIIFTIISTINVQAQDDKILDIVLPSNAFTSLDCENNLTERDNIIISVFTSDIRDAINNEKGKEIIAIIKNETKETRYEILPDVTEEDLTIDLTSDLIYYVSHQTQKKEINSRGASAIHHEYPINKNDLFEEAVKGYTKLRFSVKNRECKRITEKMIYDFKETPNMLSLSKSSNEILTYLLYEISTSPNSYPIATRESSINGFEIVNNYNGNLLFTAFLEDSKTDFRVSPNLTYLDNITIELREDDFLRYGDHIIREIEFRFGEEPISETPKDVVVKTPNTSETLPAFLYLGSSILVIIGTIIFILEIDKKQISNNN